MYRVLYRKWRPKVFADVIGQPQVTTTIASQVKENRLSHAYLFTGSRGTGKTSCAKILAKAVNCLNSEQGDACGECASCKAIDNGDVLDIVEIDAASNTGVDNIRDLKEQVNFTPASSKYRVYIIDEVHMLSIGAFNALLKTLEEPPKHIIFILPPPRFTSFLLLFSRVARDLISTESAPKRFLKEFNSLPTTRALPLTLQRPI